MLTPIFTHGTYANTIKAIETGKIKYPAYCWCTDLQLYGFINKYNELETIGIPELTGTIEDKIILSSLHDGLYQIKGQHKITAEYPTTFDTTSPIIVVIQTIGGVKKIRRITADDLTTYTIDGGGDVSVDEVATKDFLDEAGYATEEVVDEKLAVMQQAIEDEIYGYLDENLEPKIIQVVDEYVTGEDPEKIVDLFSD